MQLIKSNRIKVNETSSTGAIFSTGKKHFTTKYWEGFNDVIFLSYDLIKFVSKIIILNGG